MRRYATDGVVELTVVVGEVGEDAVAAGATEELAAAARAAGDTAAAEAAALGTGDGVWEFLLYMGTNDGKVSNMHTPIATPLLNKSYASSPNGSR